MGDKKPKEKENVVVELKVSMHCKACERTIFKTLSRFKEHGHARVEKVVTDMAKHRATVTGKMVDAEKLRKRLKNKTGKNVEILQPKKSDKKDVGGDKKVADGGGGIENEYMECEDWRLPCGSVFMVDVFSDDNPNACMIM